MADHAEDTRVKDALELLNSYAKDKRGELQDLLSNRYSNLKSVVGNVGAHAADIYGSGKEKAKQLAHDVDENVHKNPWPYIGGAALGALILGYLLGRSRK